MPQPAPLRYDQLDGIGYERDLLYAWLLNPAVVQYMPGMVGLTWEKHVAWYAQAIERRGRQDFLLIVRTRSWKLNEFPVGRVHAAGLASQTPEVGVLIGRPDMWGQGFATAAIGHIVEWLQENGPWRQCVALIHPDNAGSIKAFEANGFWQSWGPNGTHGGGYRESKLLRSDGSELDLVKETGRSDQLVFRKDLAK